MAKKKIEEEYQPQDNSDYVQQNGDVDEDLRSPPVSDLDFQAQTINPVWGKKENLTKDFQSNATQYKPLFDLKGRPIVDAKGHQVVEKVTAWGRLGAFTRDYRFGNLNQDQVNFCVYHSDLAYDMLQMGFAEASVMCTERAASTLELSQSLRGFLRIKQNTLRTEKIEQNIEPPKKGLFGGKKGGELS